MVLLRGATLALVLLLAAVAAGAQPAPLQPNNCRFVGADVGGTPSITCSGVDTNIGLNFTGKGTGTFNASGSAFTAGSVIFAGTAGGLTEDNTNFFFTNANDWLRVGPVGSEAAILSPVRPALIVNHATAPYFLMQSASGTTPPQIIGTTSRGTLAAPTASSSGDIGLDLFASGYGSNNARGNLALVRFSVDAAPGVDIVPGRLTLWTQDTAGAVRERLRLTSVGTADIGTPDATASSSLAGPTEIGNRGSNVNRVVIDSAATGSPPSLTVGGFAPDTNADLKLSGRGTGTPKVPGGGSTTNIPLSGAINVNLTSTVSTQTAKQTLLSFSLPANVLNLNGRCVRVRFWGTAKATANNKTQTIDFGATTVSSTGAVANNAGNWTVEALVCRSGSNTQVAIGSALSATTPAATNSTPTETDSGAVTIAGTSTNVTDTDGTTAKGLLVEVLN